MSRTVTATASQNIVCIDSCHNHCFCGRIYNEFLKQGYSFEDVFMFLNQMQTIYDQIGVPQNVFQPRKFDVTQVEQETVQSRDYDNFYDGAFATFHIHVLYRQNASWQGNIHWIEGKQKQAFRSVLELLQLIYQVLPKE